jgi:hypothetical protein
MRAAKRFLLASPIIHCIDRIRISLVLKAAARDHIAFIKDGTTTVENEENSLLLQSKRKLMELKMKKFMLSLAALAVVSSAAMAGDVDANSRYPYSEVIQSTSEAQALAIPHFKKGEQVFMTKDSTTTDPREVRRLDEKNGS